MFLRNSTKRLFTTINTERHFFTEKLDKGVVLFKMNRPKQRNALSKLFIQ